MRPNHIDMQHNNINVLRVDRKLPCMLSLFKYLYCKLA